MPEVHLCNPKRVAKREFAELDRQPYTAGGLHLAHWATNCTFDLGGGVTRSAWDMVQKGIKSVPFITYFSKRLNTLIQTEDMSFPRTPQAHCGLFPMPTVYAKMKWFVSKAAVKLLICHAGMVEWGGDLFLLISKQLLWPLSTC